MDPIAPSPQGQELEAPLAPPAIEAPAQGAVRQAGLTLTGALALGLAADYLFHGKPFGISVPLFLALWWAILAGVVLRRRPELTFSWLLALPAALLALAFALCDNPVLMAINVLLLPLLLGLQALLLAGLARHRWDDPRIAGDLGLLAGAALKNMPQPVRQAAAGRGLSAERRELARKLLLGAALTLPLLAFVVVLLGSADQIFSGWTSRIMDTIGSLEPWWLIRHGLNIAIVAALAAGLLWVLRVPAHEAGEEAPAEPRPFLDPLILLVPLVTLNLVYAAFNLIQLRYLFGPGEATLPEGFTYAAYARRGFFELCVVTVLNITIVLAGMFLVRRARPALVLALRVLLTLMMAQAAMILASAFLRLSLYEEAYGYTQLRLFARVMILWMAVTLALLAARAWLERFPFARGFLLSALALYIGLNYFGPDRFIAARNIDRHLAGAPLDVHYLGRLSAGAVPELTRLLASPDPQVAGEATGLLTRWRERLDQPRPWVAWNLAHQRARRALGTALPAEAGP